MLWNKIRLVAFAVLVFSVSAAPTDTAVPEVSYKPVDQARVKPNGWNGLPTGCSVAQTSKDALLVCPNQNVTLTHTSFYSESFDQIVVDTIASAPKVDYGFSADRVYKISEDMLLFSKRLNSTHVQVYCHNSFPAASELNLTKPFLINETALI